MKRIISLIAVIMITVTMVPAAVFADSSAAGTAYTKHVNPIYRDLEIGPAALKAAAVSEDDLSAVSDGVYHTTYGDAGKEIRDDLAVHKEVISVNYRMDPSFPEKYDKWYDLIAEGIFNSAVEHTGKSCEGDAIGAGYYYYEASFKVSYDGAYYYLTITYTVTYLHDAEQEAELREEIAQLKEELDIDGKPDYEKVKAIYDYMCANITYDFDSEGLLKHSAYAALVNKTCVCQGYAVLFYRLALEYGIDTRVILGVSFEDNHSWNIVKLGDKYYNLDATWDAGETEYSYFLRGSDNFPDHESDPLFTKESFTKAYPLSAEDYDASAADIKKWGDADGSGSIDSIDAMLALRFSVGLISDDQANTAVLDVNGDGSVDSIDAMLILRHSVNLIDKFPVEN